LSAALARDGVAVVAEAARPLPAFSLAGQRDAIDRCFGAADVPGVLAALAAEGTAWADETLATLRAMSPSAVLWSFAAVRRGAGQTLRQALAAELAITRQVSRHHDFLEGVRAVLVDKDRRPVWHPAAIEAVSAEATAQILA
jgi:enoyl-CoA hydratase